MKSKFYPAILIVVLTTSLITIQAFSQHNPLTNDYSKTGFEPSLNPPAVENVNSYNSLSGVSCVDNSFWAISGTSVDQFTLIGNVITKVGTTIISGAFDGNLAYCNNLNGGAYTPTFYSTIGFHQPVYYSGSGVVNTSTVTTDYIMNCGGYGNFLYYIAYDTAFKPKAIERFDGTTLTPVYHFPAGKAIAVADVAVDSLGYAWFFTGPEGSNFLADTLKVVSSTGQMIKKFPFSYNTDNAFGCFLSHGKLYLGLGGSNTVHPFTIVPLILTSETVTAGTPISMPVTTSYADMASCATGAPMALNEHSLLPGVMVFPNPISGRLTITSSSHEPAVVTLYDIRSAEVLHETFTGSTTLNLENLPYGIYLYKVLCREGKETTGKILKQ